MVPPFLLRHKGEQGFEVKSVAGRQYVQHVSIYLWCVLCDIRPKVGCVMMSKLHNSYGTKKSLLANHQVIVYSHIIVTFLYVQYVMCVQPVRLSIQGCVLDVQKNIYITYVQPVMENKI